MNCKITSRLLQRLNIITVFTVSTETSIKLTILLSNNEELYNLKKDEYQIGTDEIYILFALFQSVELCKHVNK